MTYFEENLINNLNATQKANDILGVNTFNPDTIHDIVIKTLIDCKINFFEDGEEVTVLIDNLNGVDSSANPIFIEARGKLVEPTNWALIIGVIVVAVVVIAGVTTYIVVKKKKAAKK